MYKEVDERVDNLEVILGEFIVHTKIMLSGMDRDTRELKRDTKDLKKEMRDFKDEMKVFKDEMKVFKDEMTVFKDEMTVFKDEMTVFKNEMTDFKNEMKDFKNEMKDFKNEMKDFKTEMLNDSRKSKKQWGDLANKMGTIVEDIISPAVVPVVEKYFSCEVDYKTINTRKRDNHLHITAEFDVIAVSDGFVFLVEAKSTPKTEYIDKFLMNIEKFKKLFPEYNSKKLIPIFSSLRFEEELIEYGTKKQLYMMAYREWDYMDLLNFDKVKMI
jgi:predicted  nucleic acid-binding Zn-ribbon protein